MTANARGALNTTKIIEIESIQNDIVILTGGRLRKIIAVSGVNFELKSAEEQEIIIYGYQALLNSLKSPLQIFVHSRKLNIDDYMKRLTERKDAEENPLLKSMIDNHQKFLLALTEDNAIMDKSFFAVVIYDPVSVAAVSGGIFGKLFGSSKKSSSQATTVSEKHIKEINQRTDELIAGFERIGLRSVPLNTGELEELFYDVYNPESIDHGETLAVGENEHKL